MQFWNLISLARFRYANVHADLGGPIASISARESFRLGEKVFEAFASLRPELFSRRSNASAFYGSSHGTGSSRNRSEAIYRAISEALERWAWSSSVDSPQKSNWGLDVDPSTSGFSAFPGIFSRASREASLAEACERWSLGAWWEKKTGHSGFTPPWPDVMGVHLATPLSSFTTTILWKDFPSFRAYGFAAARTIEDAARKAGIELARNIQVLEYQRSLTNPPSAESLGITERRLLFFASAQGRAQFDRRLGTTASLDHPPGLIVDREVPGPWNKYTNVWRCLFDPSALYDKGNDDYFHF